MGITQTRQVSDVFWETVMTHLWLKGHIAAIRERTVGTRRSQGLVGEGKLVE